MSDKNLDQNIIEKSVQLSLIEVLLGSFLHVAKVPFSGHFLSLNQGYFLGTSIKEIKGRLDAFKTVIEISMVTSIMKALSPAGKKFGPMMSISMQGLLFSLGILLFGVNQLGRSIGMIFLSLWAFFQPLITYFLIYGTDLPKAFTYYLKKLNKYIDVTPQTIITVIATLVTIKCTLALIVSFMKTERYEKLLNKLSLKTNMKILKKSKTPMQGVLKDILNPTFILSFALMGVYFFFTGEATALVIWKVLRALAIACIIFYLARSQKFYDFVSFLASKNKTVKRLSELAEKSLSELKKQSN